MALRNSMHTKTWSAKKTSFVEIWAEMAVAPRLLLGAIGESRLELKQYGKYTPRRTFCIACLNFLSLCQILHNIVL